MTLKENLVPLKFIFLKLQLIGTLSTISSRKENILASFSYKIIQNSSDYKKADSSLIAALSISIIFLILEIFLLFIGLNLRYNKIHVFSIFWHFLGTVLVFWFTFDNWDFSYFWGIWFFCNFIPFFFEIISSVQAFIFFRKYY